MTDFNQGATISARLLFFNPNILNFANPAWISIFVKAYTGTND
jgi:hypothetical protein